MALGTTGMVLAAAIVAGAAGAGTAVLVMEAGRPAPAPAEGAPDRVPALEEQISRQEKEITELRGRVEEAAHARPPAPQTVTVGPQGSTSMEIPGKVQVIDEKTGKPVPPAGETPGSDVLASLSPEERSKFEAVYKAMRAKEQEDAEKARLAAQATNLRTRLDRLPENLALTDAQKDAAVKILMDRDDRMRKVPAEIQAAGSDDAGRRIQERRAAIRQEAEQQLQQSLTQDQARAVEQIADRGAIGGRPRTGNFNGRGNGTRTANPGAGTTPPPGGQPAPK